MDIDRKQPQNDSQPWLSDIARTKAFSAFIHNQQIITKSQPYANGLIHFKNKKKFEANEELFE